VVRPWRANAPPVVMSTWWRNFWMWRRKGAALDLLREKAEVSFFLVREKIRFSLRIINQICLN
jgi:hypothetical protein